MKELFITRPDGARIRIHDHADRLNMPLEDAPALVLSNSLLTDMSLWDDVISTLASHIRIIGYDTRGHGGSTTPSKTTTLQTLRDDLVAVMDAVNVEKAFIAGISLGGMTAQQLAVDAPHRMLGLIACNCRANIDAAGIDGWEQRLALLRDEGMDTLATQTLGRWFAEDFRDANPATMDRVRGMINGTAAEGFEACVRAIQGLDLLDRIHAIRMPALFVAGAQDGAASPATMREMAEKIPDATCEVLDPCGHLSSIQRPDVLASLIARFIADHPVT